MKNYNIFFTSDTHFGHANMIKFVNWDGSRVRPFDTWEEADEKMVENWNKVVRSQDKVYMIGDLFCGCRKDYAESIMSRLNGNIHLIAGNHDTWKASWYLKYCYNVSGSKNLDSFLITHIPIHPGSKARFKMNIHGHTHCNNILLPDGTQDPWYKNVCMDANNYTPIPYEEITREYSIKIQTGVLQRPKERMKGESEHAAPI